MDHNKSPRNVTLEEIAGAISPGDLLAFAYVHAGYTPVFDALAKFNPGPDYTIFILSTLRYRDEHLFPLDRVCRDLKARVIVEQLAPQFAGLFKEGRAEVLPMPMSQLPRYLQYQSTHHPLWLFCEITPPDPAGVCNTGNSGPFPLALYDSCRVVGLINDRMPPTCGDTAIPLAKFDYLLKLPQSILPLYPEPEITEDMRKIGENVAGLIDNGAVVQVGVGGVISSILKALVGKSGLKILSGILPGDVQALVESGVVRECIGEVTGAYSDDFYRWLKMNPRVMIKTVDFTHNLGVLSRQVNFVAINSAVSVDLYGQVVSETIGATQITGLGGALDYARGAYMGGGKSIIAIQSTYGKGASRIVPAIETGNVISLTRYDVDYVVTEYGIAELRYRTRGERVRELVRIAHPGHREVLLDRAREMKII